MMSALLNIISMGLTGVQLARQVGSLRPSDPNHLSVAMAPPSLTAAFWMILLLIPLSVFSSGEVNELKDRDCTHPQYNLEGLAQAAEIAVIQAGDTSVWLWKASGETSGASGTSRTVPRPCPMLRKAPPGASSATAPSRSCGRS